MIKDHITSKLASSQNLTDKKNVLYENTLSILNQQVCPAKGHLKKPESAVVTTCNEKKNSGNFRNIKSVDENIQESTITSRKCLQMTTNVNNNMERSVLLQINILKTKSYLNLISNLS